MSAECEKMSSFPACRHQSARPHGNFPLSLSSSRCSSIHLLLLSGRPLLNSIMAHRSLKDKRLSVPHPTSAHTTTPSLLHNGRIWLALGFVVLVASIFIGKDLLTSSVSSSDMARAAPKRHYPAVSWQRPLHTAWTAQSALLDRLVGDVQAHHQRMGEWPLVVLTSDAALGPVGKSTLARAAAARLGLRIIEISATDGDVALSALDVKQRLIAAVARAASQDVVVPALNEADTLELFDSLFLTPQPSAAAAAAASSAHAALTGHLQNVTLILDDVTSREQLLELHRDGRASGPLFVTARNRLAEAEAAPRALVLQVGALTTAQAAEWLAAAVAVNLAGKARLVADEAQGLVEALNLRTPLDLDLVTKHVTTEAALAALTQRAQQASHAERTPIAAAYSLLSAPEQQVLVHCSAFGVPFDSEAFAALFPESNPNYLEVLAERGFLTVSRRADPPLYSLWDPVATFVRRLAGAEDSADRARHHFVTRLEEWPLSGAPSEASAALYAMRTPLHWVAQSTNHTVLTRLLSALRGASWPLALRMDLALARVAHTLDATAYDPSAHARAVTLPLLQVRAKSAEAVRLTEHLGLVDSLVREMHPSGYGGLCGALGPTSRNAKKAAQRGQRRFLKRLYASHNSALRPADAVNGVAAWLEAHCEGRYKAHELADGAFWATIGVLGNDHIEAIALVQYEFEFLAMSADDKYREYVARAWCDACV